MTKEEYLNNYREEKLAEICEDLEKKNNSYREELRGIGEAYGKVKHLEGVFESGSEVFKKIQKMPASEFLSLYAMMKGLME